MLTGIIRGQRLMLRTPIVVADSINYLTAKFTFDPDWAGRTITAYFVCGNKAITAQLAGGEITAAQGVNLTAGRWELKLSGIKGDSRVTAGPVWFDVLPFGAADGELPDISLTQYEQLLAKIGENMNLRRAAMLEVSNGVIASYVHNACKPNLGKIGVLVALESNGDKAKLQELGKHIAMHVAASNPQFLTIADVDQASIDHEKAIFSEQAKASGKPENIIEKMVEGRIKKYFDEVVLEEQAYIMDPDKKVKQIVADAAKEMGADIKLKAFVCFRLGEGLEKRNEDFAAEVASQLKK